MLRGTSVPDPFQSHNSETIESPSEAGFIVEIKSFAYDSLSTTTSNEETKLQAFLKILKRTLQNF